MLIQPERAVGSTRLALAVATAATAAAFACQALLVNLAYGNDWSALFYAGAEYGHERNRPHESGYLFPGFGYDGQIYHAIAHDPLLRNGVSAHVDAPRLRYQRILVPVLAWAAAGGDPGLVDRAYRVVILAFVFLGCYWSGQLAAAFGRSPWWGAAFLFLPATVVSLERMTVDVALAALVAGWAVASTRKHSRLKWIVLALAPLVRETGLILVAASAILAYGERKPSRGFLSLATTVPGIAWYAFVHSRTPPFVYPNSFVPLAGVLEALLHPAGHATTAGANVGAWKSMARAALPFMDGMALIGMVSAFVLAAVWLQSDRRSGLAWAAALFAVLGVFTQRADNWIHVYDFGRVYSPLLLLLAANGLARRQPWWALPWCLVEPRLLYQLTGPAMAAARSLFS